MATLLLLLTIALTIPSSFSQCNRDKALPFFQRSVHEFSVELVKRIALENDNHFITSALSPWTLIAALSHGADGETLQEIQQVLRLHHHSCFNTKIFEIVQQLSEAEDGTVLERSSTIFVDDKTPVTEVFKSRIQKTKISELKQVSFDDTYAVANTINDYVSEKTHGTVEEIVDASDLRGVLMVLIDALYFKGTWQTSFSAEDTEEAAFYDERSNQIGDVNLMFGMIDANMTAVPHIGATVLELPYTKGRFSMLFFLPDEGTTITSVLEKFNQISMRTIFALLGQTYAQRVLVQIPKFKMYSNLDNMKEWLADMGLRSMFDENEASFPYIAPFKIYVSNFIQKAMIQLTEEGTEASAASAAMLMGRSAGPAPAAQFTANRPFLFMIVDRENEIALFTGAYSKPRVDL